MPITAQIVRDTVDAYLAEHPDEKDALSPLREVVEQAGDSIASRKEFRGHVTAGAALLRPDGRVLTIEHRALRTWLLPGGYAKHLRLSHPPFAEGFFMSGDSLGAGNFTCLKEPCGLLLHLPR